MAVFPLMVTVHPNGVIIIAPTHRVQLLNLLCGYIRLNLEPSVGQQFRQLFGRCRGKAARHIPLVGERIDPVPLAKR